MVTEIADLEFTKACLDIKKKATLSGEPLTDVTACAPSTYETPKIYNFGDTKHHTI
ncbi:hypothetical protein [Lactiplantibacillus plajomi]|uniref:Uncharacterized protein n=1 Tax=Lactiplantibacillus plajomi TaxID=1457217 RepID=A0ABV6K2I3_9LACO|nr:hypothetical protein [Lactiplantibacillus plajomi]